MKLIPFERFIIDTQLKKDEVKARLEKRIGQNKANNFKRIDQNYFYGGLSGDTFKIHPILDHRNSWKPFLFWDYNRNQKRDEDFSDNAA